MHNILQSTNEFYIFCRPKERKKRLSSRRTSSIDKDLIPLQQDVIEKKLLSPPIIVNKTVAESVAVDTSTSPKGPLPPPEDAPPPVVHPVKERVTRTRSLAASANAAEETPPPPPAPVPPPAPTPSRRARAESSNGASRHRNKSGTEPKAVTPPTESQASSSAQRGEASSSTKGSSSKPLSREERKLQSVLKLIERMENNQRKKESRQTQKKEKGKDSKEKDDEHEEDHHSDTSVQTPAAPAASTRTVKFAPTSSGSPGKRKGRRRGRSGSHSGGGSKVTSPRKPQLISQRSSGSGGDMRSTSTESDVNSADESKTTTEAGSQLESSDSNFRLPKTKKLMMTEWYRSNSPTPTSSPSGGDPSSFPQQYIRRNMASPGTVVASTSSSSSVVTTPTTCSTTSFNPITPNTSMENASAKKRWLRQAISEETDASSPNSRPLSPVATGDCLAPLKKRLARSSMSSELSNTPPTTPPTNQPDGHNSEHEQEPDGMENEELTISASYEGGRRVQSRILSVSEISSAEDEDMEVDDEKPISISEPINVTSEKPVDEEKVEELKPSDEEVKLDDCQPLSTEQAIPPDTKEPELKPVQIDSAEEINAAEEKEIPSPHQGEGTSFKESATVDIKNQIEDRSEKKEEEVVEEMDQDIVTVEEAMDEDVNLEPESPPKEMQSPSGKTTSPETGIICDTIVSGRESPLKPPSSSSQLLARSPTRRSRWDQIEASESIGSSPCTSPVKGTSLAEPIILDYKRDRSICLKLNFNAETGDAPARKTVFGNLLRANLDSMESTGTGDSAPGQSKAEVEHGKHPQDPLGLKSPNESQFQKYAPIDLNDPSVTTPTKRKVIFENTTSNEVD
jgi:hypothetical protein